MEASDKNLGLVQDAMNDIIRMMEIKIYGDILSTATDAMDKVKSPVLRQNMTKSDFEIEAIRQKPVTIYLILPLGMMKSHSPWLRISLQSFLSFVLKNQGHRITFLMDEFFQLSYLEFIEAAMGSTSGLNITLWPILKDLTQLQKLYGDSGETFIANSRIQHYYR